MLFNSFDFAIFLPIVFGIYWFVTNRNLKIQNLFLVAASYLFYGWWDWRFLSLILFSTVVDYVIGLSLGKTDNPGIRKVGLWTSIIVNLGFLGFFKYYNFFAENFAAAFTFLGQDIQAHSLHIVLPVGISFYTFQTMSYTIDVYRGNLKPTKDFVQFAAYVSFFPQLVAGPIERATNLLPQFREKRRFDYSSATDGLRQILWGLFKKVVIADNCATIVNEIFNHSDKYQGSTLLLGAVFFAFQIYGDFSGYSDIAIGTARLFGFNLMRNFAYPYFSRDMAEFWRRWHISLSTWFRDYVYIPLGGSRGSKLRIVRNTFIIFIVSGFWHGANWTFIAWGALNAIYFLPLLLLRQNRSHLEIVAEDRVWPDFKEVGQILFTFILTVIAWVFFRADNMPHALHYLANMFSLQLFSLPVLFPKQQLLLIFLFILVEWFGRRDHYAIEKLVLRWPPVIRYGFYYTLTMCILFLSTPDQQFIYFQF